MNTETLENLMCAGRLGLHPNAASRLRAPGVCPTADWGNQVIAIACLLPSSRACRFHLNVSGGSLSFPSAGARTVAKPWRSMLSAQFGIWHRREQPLSDLETAERCGDASRADYAGIWPVFYRTVPPFPPKKRLFFHPASLRLTQLLRFPHGCQCTIYQTLFFVGLIGRYRR